MIHHSGSPKAPYCITHLALLTVFESGQIGFERCGWQLVCFSQSASSAHFRRHLNSIAPAFNSLYVHY